MSEEYSLDLIIKETREDYNKWPKWMQMLTEGNLQIKKKENKTVGISTREDWDIELIDIGLVPREYLMFDEVKARKVVRVSKGAVQIPGVKNVKKTIVSQR